MGCLVPYEPLDQLKPVAEDVWIIDGPEVGMRYFGLSVPFPTRCTIVRLEGRRLWVHSPTPLTPVLRDGLNALGDVAALVAPNILHHSWMDQWRAAYPEAEVFSGPPPGRAAPPPALSTAQILTDHAPELWRGVIDQRIARGDLFSEAVFFHRPSATLILTDLIENFEPDRVRCTGWRWIMQMFGAADPHGSAPYDMRLSFWRERHRLREIVRTMLDWAPERVIIAHGRWYEADAAGELRRAFAWVKP